MNTHILLLGGTGFIGEYLIENLSTRKNCEVTTTYKNTLTLKSESNTVHYVQLDLTKPHKKLSDLINSASIVVILTQPNKRIVNNVISAIKPESHLKKIIYLSSALLYANSTNKQSETFTLNPITDYERGKYEEELILSDFVKKNNLQLCIARLSNVYGGIKNRGLINFIFLSIINNSKMIINGKGDSVRDYIFVADVINWLTFLIFYKQKNKKEVFNICTGQGYSVKEVVQAIEKIVGKKVGKISGRTIKEKKMIVGNNKKIKKSSKIKSKFKLIEGLQQTYKNYIIPK